MLRRGALSTVAKHQVTPLGLYVAPLSLRSQRGDSAAVSFDPEVATFFRTYLGKIISVKAESEQVEMPQ